MTDSNADNERRQESSEPSSPSLRRVATASEIEHRQMEQLGRQRKRRRRLIGGGAILALVLVVGGYLVMARLLMRNARERYQSVVREMNMEVYRAFNPAGLERANATLRETQETAAYFRVPFLMESAKEPLNRLRKNYAIAQKNESAFEEARGRYRLRRQEALDHHVPELLPKQWDKLKAREPFFIGDYTREEFSYEKAREELEEALGLLNTLRSNYESLDAYRTERARFQKTMASLTPKEWKAVLPAIHQRLEELREQARSAAEGRHWDVARMAMEQFRQLVAENRDSVRAARSAARKRMDEATAELSELQTSAAKAAGERLEPLKQTRTAMQKAFENYRYDEVQEHAAEIQEGVAAVENEQSALQERRKTLEETYRPLYEAASRQKEVFRRNWPEMWRRVQEKDRRIRALAEDGENVGKLVETMEAAEEELKSLMTRAQKTAKAARSVIRQVRERIADADMKRLQRNLPDLHARIEELRQTMESRWKTKVFEEAADAGKKALAALDDATASVGDLAEKARSLRKTAFGSLDTFAAGLEAYRSSDLETLRDLRREASRKMENESFAKALPDLRRMRELLPVSRFFRPDDGTVVDFASGLMWASAPPAGPSSTPWYQALNAADNLQFAGHTNWRMPSRRELRTLQALPDKERARLFPTLLEGVAVWTADSVEKGGNTAYAIKIGTFAERELPKSEAALILPVRTPEE